MANKRVRKSEDSIEDFIERHFEENFQRLRFESGHGLAPEVKQAAKRQVILYWRKLKHIAETITDTEVRLNLPGLKTSKKRKFSIEGIVDIVREQGRTVMYDLKTHEGFATVANKIPVLHAWNVDAEGSVVDSTWEPVGSIYFGIIFPPAIVERAKTSVLDDFESGWPVLRESWTEMVAGIDGLVL